MHDPFDIGVEVPSYVGAIEPEEYLKKSWVWEDKDPPDDSSHSSWLSRMNLALETKLTQLIEHLAEQGNIGEQEAQRRLHRIGTPALIAFITGKLLPEKEATLADYRAAAKRAAAYVPGESHGYEDLDETVSFSLPQKRLSRRSYALVWWEKDYLTWGSDQLGISGNDAFRLSLAMAGVILGKSGMFPNPLYEGVQDIADKCTEQATQRAERFREAFILTMNEAFEKGYGEEVMQNCLAEALPLAMDYLANIGNKSRAVQHVNPSPIIRQSDDHPLAVVERIDDLQPGPWRLPRQIVMNYGRIEYPSPPPQRTPVLK